ncbi:hypothetical protein [Persicitalea jodogahamensis]|uniref:Uncharacterized protein n=1 Tax=Persicitalea jodogahamensis TaxID=402147 RepID=A0A8J3GAQ0_9BACT|nr:hypothetical protein [Persicitalea jodogahamensis]GHB76478.1 hypothetical protein GCM10007390_33020 [Persicitalea jodogahamensis]
MNLLVTLRERNKLLCYVGMALLIGALLLLIPMAADDTQILGINRWIKPFKFLVSSGIYLLTFAWLCGDLPQSRFIRLFASQITLAVVIENVAITVQAARGVKSHFNMESASGGIVFALMGFFIVYSTIWVMVFTYRYIRANLSKLPGPYVLGARLGLLLFLVGSFLGGYMSAQRGHTVGGPDGGPGLPLLNWSTGFGDLRVAHSFGLHGLQVLMLLGVYVASLSLKASQKSALVWIAFAGILIFISWTYWQATQGVPLVAA